MFYITEIFQSGNGDGIIAFAFDANSFAIPINVNFLFFFCALNAVNFKIVFLAVATVRPFDGKLFTVLLRRKYLLKRFVVADIRSGHKTIRFIPVQVIIIQWLEPITVITDSLLNNRKVKFKGFQTLGHFQQFGNMELSGVFHTGRQGF